MWYETYQVLTIGVVLTIGAVVQGAVGFAAGLISVPLLVLANFSLPEAATINLVSTSVQNGAGAWKLWSELEPRELVYPVSARLAGVPVGVWCLSLVDQLGVEWAKQMIGILLLAIVVTLNVFRPQPRDRLGPFWSTAAFVSSGFLLGFAAIGGAPLVLYVNSLTWSAAKSRAFLFFCSIAAFPLMAVLVAWRFGSQVAPAAGAALAAMPLVFVGLWAGLKLGDRLDKQLFRRLTYALLTVIALASVAAPWLKP
ncbi:MAG: sulfite exporter TauE/SafE family protein [Planctomycetales bacterium]|nr:sulfite exporter TauE/SafE family protein [Planctomycetales bacterium]